MINYVNLLLSVNGFTVWLADVISAISIQPYLDIIKLPQDRYNYNYCIVIVAIVQKQITRETNQTMFCLIIDTTPL